MWNKHTSVCMCGAALLSHSTLISLTPHAVYSLAIFQACLNKHIFTLLDVA